MNEDDRVRILDTLNVLYTPKEERFECITHLLKQIFKVKVSGIALVHKDIVWFKSLQGLPQAIAEIPRREYLADNALSADGLLIIEDALKDESYKLYPWVSGEPKLRFYASVHVRTIEGFVLGDIFIGDDKPRTLTVDEKDVILDISQLVLSEILNLSITKKVLADQTKTQSELMSRNREIEEERAQFSAMLENIGDAIVGINDKGEITFANDQTFLLTDYSQEELVGKMYMHVLRLVDKEGNEIPAVNRPIRNALFTQKRITTSDYSYLKKDGSKFSVSITATPVIVFGKVIGGIIVFRDITKEKEVDRMKTEFISLASHQLRTPLSAVKWFCEILIDDDTGTLNKEQRDMLENIYKSNERMIDLVNTLLNISRIESGRIIIEPKPTDIKGLLEEVILEVKQRYNKKNQHLAISIHENLPLINLDPKLIRHVYMNLLTNAIKYTPEGGDIIIMISKTDTEMISQVSDNGYGIPESQQKRVFQKFFRAENIVKVETDGTGLGLYLTKAVVESSGGRIWFTSKEHEGTTFWFALPLSGSREKQGEVSLDG